MRSAGKWLATLNRPTLAAQNWLYLAVQAVIFLIGVILMQHGGTWQGAVGSGLIATAIAGWVLFLHVRLQETTSRRLDILARFGFLDAFPYRSISIRSQYEVRLHNVTRNIDILGFGLNALRQDFRSDFPSWAAQAHVRVLLIDPKSPPAGNGYAQARALEEGEQEDSISTEVRHFLEETADLRAKEPGRFQVRLYTALPSVNIFRVDDEMFWGPYLLGQQSRNTPTFLIGRGVLFDQLGDHFDRMWHDQHSHDA